MRGRGCEGKRQKEAHTHRSCGMINSQLKNIKQVQLAGNAMAILVLAVSWQSRVFTRQINMQKYTWDGEELNIGLHQSDDNANSHLPTALCVRTNIISCPSEAASLVH